MANATASLSQHGQRFRPHLLTKTVNSDSGEVKHYKPVEEYPIYLKDEANWDIVADAMHSVLTSNEGTGYRFGRNPPTRLQEKQVPHRYLAVDNMKKQNMRTSPKHYAITPCLLHSLRLKSLKLHLQLLLRMMLQPQRLHAKFSILTINFIR